MLSACGGGGGNGDGDESSETTDSTLIDSSVRPDSDSSQEKVAAAAKARPAVGSVTQSSNTVNGITTDSVSTSVGYNENNQIIYNVRNGPIGNPKWSVDSSDSDDTTTIEAARGPSGDWNYIEMFKRLPMGRLWVDVYTTFGAAATDTDYAAGGIWVYVPDDTTSVGDYEFGAFIHVEDPYMQSNIMGLMGEHAYTGEGDVTGVYSVLAEERNHYFYADVTLTADFGDTANLGTIGGYIDNVSVDDELVENNPKLYLGTANIGNTNSGFFTGNTRMQYDGKSFAGKWGGQFFGNNGSDAPIAVGGTFGAATDNNDTSLLGVYGATRTP